MEHAIISLMPGQKNDSATKDDVLTLNYQVKSDKSDILVLDRMIE